MFFLLNIISFINIKTNFVLNYLIIYKYLLFILIIISALIFKLSKKKFDNLDISFIVLYFFICFLCYDRYFLDEDEFTYWGQRIKDIYYYIDTQNFKIQTYHQPFLTSWQILFTVILGFEENIIIFANNIIIISGFFYLVGNFCNKEKYKLFFIFIILFYLLINNLSFGLVSIYADPILAVLSSCILKLIFDNKYDKTKTVLFFFLILCLWFTHRLGVVFSILFLFYFFLKNFNYLTSEYKKILIPFILMGFFLVIFFFLNKNIYFQNTLDVFNFIGVIVELFKSFIFEIKKIFLVEIYYSSFGVSLNKIIEFILNKETNMNNISLNILIWTILIILICLINYKKKIVFYFLTSLISLLFMRYIEKI